MGKFVFKFFIIFFSFISLLFFSLIAFNGQSMEKMMSQGAQFAGNAPPPPPVIVPFIFIMVLSFIFIYFVLRYINKNFVEPLEQIESNVKKIKEGSLDVEF